MKKIILIIMIFLIFSSGCKESSNNGNIEKPDIKISANPSISHNSSDDMNIPNITNTPEKDFYEPVNLLTIYNPAYSNRDKYYNMMDWQEYINEKFGIEINVFYNIKELKGAHAIYYFNYHIGYPYWGADEVYKYINEGGITESVYDLSRYYEEYGWSKFIDPEYIEEMKIDGRIYVVPTAPNKYIIPRFYNVEYLKQLGMEVPTTINSFENYLIESKKIMKGDGLPIPMFVPERNIFQCTSDIFRAFGVYVNSEQQSTLTFNPNTMSFEDAVFSEDIETALGFFRSMMDQGLMSINGEVYDSSLVNKDNQFIGDKLRVNKNFATEYNIVYKNDGNSFRRFLLAATGYDTVSGYYLTHTNIRNVCEIRSDMGFYVFPKNIENIKGTMEIFNETMMNKEFYPDFLYGMENIDYFINNDEIVPNMPSLGTFQGIRLLTFVEDSRNYYSPGNIDVTKQIQKDLMYESNIYKQAIRYRDIVGNMTVSGSMHSGLFMTGIPIEEAIAHYKEWFYGWGMHEMVIKLNERIGTVPSYDYSKK